jgi:hypothetical protein
MGDEMLSGSKGFVASDGVVGFSVSGRLTSYHYEAGLVGVFETYPSTLVSPSTRPIDPAPSHE